MIHTTAAFSDIAARAARLNLRNREIEGLRERNVHRSLRR
jgi:hypothetical protein